MHDTWIAAQEILHTGFVQALQRNIHSLQPSAESGNGIDLAWHRRGQESFLLNACQIDVQIWRKRPDVETLKEFGINDRFHALKNGRPRQRVGIMPNLLA